MDRVGRAPLGFFRGEGGILSRQLPRQPVGRVVGLARTGPHEPRGHTADDHRRQCGHSLLYREASARLPGPGAQDHQQQGDRYDETARPYRPGGGGRHHDHVGLLLQERAPRNGQDLGGEHQDHGGRRQQVEVPLGRRSTECQQGLPDQQPAQQQARGQAARPLAAHRPGTDPELQDDSQGHHAEDAAERAFQRRLVYPARGPSRFSRRGAVRRRRCPLHWPRRYQSEPTCRSRSKSVFV